MSSLKKKLTLMFQGELEKIISSLFDQDFTNFLDEENFEKLLSVIQDKSSRYTKLEAFEHLQKGAKLQTNWTGALKALMVLHKLMHSVGGDLMEFFPPQKITNISKFPTDRTNLKSLIHSAIVPTYYNYLQKLGYNYEDLQVCFFVDGNYSQKLTENKLSLLHFVSKLQNTLNYLCKLLPLIEASLEQFNNLNMMKQLCYFCLTDCYYYYSYINHIISALTKDIYDFGEEDVVFLYELYSEHIKMTKQLQQFFALKSYIPEFEIKEPNFYSLDVNFNRNLELHILSLKKDFPFRQTNRISDLDNKSTNPHTLATEETKQTNRKPLPHTIDLTQITPQLITSNHDKQLFAPPTLRKKTQRTYRLEVNEADIISENEEEKEETFKKDVERGSNNFLKVPSSQLNYLKVPNDSGVFFKNDRMGTDTYCALGTYSPNQSSNNSFTDSYIVG